MRCRVAERSRLAEQMFNPQLASAYLAWLTRQKLTGSPETLAAFQAGWSAHNHRLRARRKKKEALATS